MKTKNLTFMEAINFKDKKIRRAIWRSDFFLRFDDNQPVVKGGFNLGLFDFQATDWEIVEDKKTLSDNVIDVIEGTEGMVSSLYPEEDVKKALKEFIEWITGDTVLVSQQRVKEKAKELFGDRLV